MIKKLALILILAFLLLTACTDTSSISSPPSNISEEVLPNFSESASQTLEPSTETEPADINTYEALTETGESKEILYPPTPRLLYNGEIYAYLIGSQVTEVDGKLYELRADEIIEPFIDAEQMKEECEYIGQSTPISVDFMPENELEFASYFDVPFKLYKIDEDQILAYCVEDYEIPEEQYKQTMFYPGTYRAHMICVKNLDGTGAASLIAKYYRYKERFPNDYRNWMEIYGITTEE